MLADLPLDLQIRIIQCLVTDNFPEAKQLHDQWLQEHPIRPSNPYDISEPTACC